ncbi:hypothetical protein SJ05684_c07740 [Sinorhizobium sojae CCBAU 05684]|uniref:Uncharacterized protein n=1 Tax=Sinorhizobium sojae CCBAU 05684 TaxID=716928 RepID=A0A249P954_9HYPH|nr:hypothetical protein SJ05684_c07740 [Sinorhizobium sojae CCBAU 05684]
MASSWEIVCIDRSYSAAHLTKRAMAAVALLNCCMSIS